MDDVWCEQCPAGPFSEDRFLVAHRLLMHSETEARAKPPAWPKRVPMLGCRSCSQFFDDAVCLIQHVALVHGRVATREERTPLAPEQQEVRLRG